MPSGCEVVKSRRGDQIQLEYGSDVRVEFVNIHDDSCTKDWEV